MSTESSVGLNSGNAAVESRGGPFVVLAAVDASANAARVISSAAGLAQLVHGAELNLVYVVEDAPAVMGAVMAVSTQREALKGARQRLSTLAEGLQERRGLHTRVHLAVGTPWREIVELGSELSADLIVVGTHGREGLERILLGSVAQAVVRKASCPVLVVRPKTPHASDVPEIEPPCPDCVAVRRASAGAQVWCARHREHHPVAHTYSEVPESFAMGSMLIR